MVCLGRPYYFNFFKGCLPQILLGVFLNTLTQMIFYINCKYISENKFPLNKGIDLFPKRHKTVVKTMTPHSK